MRRRSQRDWSQARETIVETNTPLRQSRWRSLVSRITRTPWLLPLCLGVLIGNLLGFIIGVTVTASGQVMWEDYWSEEKPAETQQTRSHDRAAFVLKYPNNWRLDTKDKYHDPDTNFSVQSPGRNFMSFEILDMEADSKGDVRDRVEYWKKHLKSAQQSTFSRWGRYKGSGVQLKGKFLRVYPFTVRTFSHSSSNRSFLVSEQFYDEDAKDVMPGLQLIESTFRWKNITPAQTNSEKPLAKSKDSEP